QLRLPDWPGSMVCEPQAEAECGCRHQQPDSNRPREPGRASRQYGGGGDSGGLARDGLQLGAQIGGAVEAIGGILLKAGAKESIERVWCEWLDGAERLRFFFQDGAHHADLALAQEGAAAGDHLV